jgi:hypothetical protein
MVVLKKKISKKKKPTYLPYEDEVKAQPATVRFIGSRTKAPPDISPWTKAPQ